MGNRKEALGNSESVGQTISASEEWQEAGSPELEWVRLGPCWAHLCYLTAVPEIRGLQWRKIKQREVKKILPFGD